jgi:pimeloyl-ACP methyl ester carboxylesterase
MSNANVVAEKKSKGAGCLRWLGRVALGFLIVLLGLAAAGAIYQAVTSARDAKTYKPADQMVDVNGIQMRLDCRGSGSPTVVLEAGGQSWSTHWRLVQDEVAEFTRVCSYDRAGSGWSEPVDEELNPQHAAEMLHALLENGGEKPPYLMVGHSFGGVFIRAFMAQYPDEVVGMVFVDSSHDDQTQRIPPEIANSPETAQARNKALATLRIYPIVERLGLIRAFKLYDPTIASLKFAEKDKALLLAEMYRTGYFEAIGREVDMMNAYESQPRELKSLGDLPLIALTRKVTAQDMIVQIPSTLQTMELAQQLADIVNDMQEELVALSTQGELIIVEDTGHNIQFDKPQAVIDAIREVFEQVAK